MRAKRVFFSRSNIGSRRVGRDRAAWSELAAEATRSPCETRLGKERVRRRVWLASSTHNSASVLTCDGCFPSHCTLPLLDSYRHS